jgi:opacity protein-like surface antigen
MAVNRVGVPTTLALCLAASMGIVGAGVPQAIAQSTQGVKPSPAPAQPSTPPPSTKPTAGDQAKPPAPTDPAKKGVPKPAAPSKAAGPAKRPGGPPSFHFAGFAGGGYQGFAATDTFDATIGNSSGPVWGVGGSVTHRSGIFGQVDVTQFRADGERVFVFDGQVFPLGIPLTVEVMPIEISFGYKFFVRPPRPKAAPPPPPPPKPLFQPARPRPEEKKKPTASPKAGPATTAAPASPAKPPLGGLKPYLGGGFGWVGYKETSDFAASGEDTDDRFTSFHVLGGVEVPLWKWIGAAAEFNYRWAGGAFGEAGVSREFGEDDLGGPSFRVKLTIGR